MRIKLNGENGLREEMGCEVRKKAKLGVQWKRKELNTNKRENGRHKGMKKC